MRRQREARMRYISRLLLLSLLAVVLAACGSDGEDEPGTTTGSSQPTAAPKATATTFAAGSTMDTIAKRGKITIGVKYDVPLFGLLDPATKKVDGFDVAIGKEIAKALGLREDQVEFVEAISAKPVE